jgi:hypothetical protein
MTGPMSSFLLIAVTAFLLVSPRLALATLIDSAPVTLDLRDQQAVTIVACSNRRGAGAEHFDAYHVGGSAKSRISATVRCAAHDSMSGFPVKHFSRCEKRHNSWRCDGGADYLEYRDRDTVVYLVTETGLQPATQVRVMNSLLEGDSHEARDFRSHFNDNQCWMRRTIPSQFRLECGLVTVDIAEECREDNCSYEPKQIRIAIP